MNTKKIIIVSASEQLQSFFKLEAQNFDFFVDCIEKIDRAHNDLSSYDLAVIDKDTIKQMPLNTAKEELTVSSQNKNADIFYPCLISDLKSIYGSLYTQSSVVDNSTDDSVRIFFYNNEKNVVSVNNRKYILSDTEYKILTLLSKSSQDVVLREDIQKLFENEKSNISDVYICKLRKKLEASLGQRLIFTVREKGYKLVAQAEWR